MQETNLTLVQTSACNRMINLNYYFCCYYKSDFVEDFRNKASQFKVMDKDKNATMDNEFLADLQFYS